MIAAAVGVLLAIPTLATAGRGNGGDGKGSKPSTSIPAATSASSSTGPTKHGAPPPTTTTVPTTTPPDTTITSGPAAFSSVFGDVTFGFSATEQSTFQCAADSAAYGPCSGAATATLSGLSVGFHTFRVRATDLAGNVDPTPASVAWFSGYTNSKTYLAGSLLAQAQASPTAVFHVIVETKSDASELSVQSGLADTATAKYAKPKVGDPFVSISGFPAKLPGWALLWMTDTYPGISNITLDRTVKDPLPPSGFSPKQVWQSAIGADRLWDASKRAVQTPAIAVIDSGIDTSEASNFGARVIARVNLGKESSSLDDYGHGTFVAGIAAGAATSYPGVAPTAPLVDVRVIGADGSADTSNVISGIDWVLQNRSKYGIKVVNLSLQSSKANSFRFDPLDHAVEALWLAGITVVTSAGNGGDGTPQKMNFAPANDPFVITVGAADVHDTADVSDDDVVSWSAFGTTADGFSEPTLVAPGRQMVGPVPSAATLPTTRPDKVVAPGYMTLSGTSLSAAAVSGAAAQLLALHPTWGPDQVKGALMLSANHIATASIQQAGVGEVDVSRAASLPSAPTPISPSSASSW